MMTRSRTALVTGSTDGLGRLVARKLAAAGFEVLVHGRNRERGEAVVGGILADGGTARFYEADFASLAAVQRLGETILREHAHLDLLINNAGLGTGGRGLVRTTSAEGHELRFAVNYLAGYLLTRTLLATLLASAPARIVNVTSGAQYPLDFGNLMLTRAFSGFRAYAQSKLAQVMFTFELARELQGTGVTVNCLHPANFMDTHMVRESGARPTSTVEEGAEAVCYVAMSPQLRSQTGLYVVDGKLARAHAQAYDEKARTQLLALSAEWSAPFRDVGPRSGP
jgi:NAD(P)-dependent dehydrogenase (short-subunit alcohol dehydrogenase family)